MKLYRTAGGAVLETGRGLLRVREGWYALVNH